MKHSFALLALAASTQAIAVQNETSLETNDSETPCQQLLTRVKAIESLKLSVPDLGDVTLAAKTRYRIEGYGPKARVNLALDLEMTLNGEEVSEWASANYQPVFYFQYSEEDVVAGIDFDFHFLTEYDSKMYSVTYFYEGAEQPKVEDYDSWFGGPETEGDNWRRAARQITDTDGDSIKFEEVVQQHRAFLPVMRGVEREDRVTTAHYERELADEEVAAILQHGKTLTSSVLLLDIIHGTSAPTMTVNFEWPPLGGTAYAEDHGLLADQETAGCDGAYSMPQAPISGLDSMRLSTDEQLDVSISGSTSYEVLGTCPGLEVTLYIDFEVSLSEAWDRYQSDFFEFWFVYSDSPGTIAGSRFHLDTERSEIFADNFAKEASELPLFDYDGIYNGPLDAEDGWSFGTEYTLKPERDGDGERNVFIVEEEGMMEPMQQHAFKVVKDGTSWAEDSFTVRFAKKLSAVEAPDVLERGMEISANALLFMSIDGYSRYEAPAGSITLEWLPKA